MARHRSRFASGNERERVIQYVYQRYGPRGAHDRNVITIASHGAREMGKVMDLTRTR